MGLDDAHPQQVMAPWLWLLLVMAVNLFGVYAPTHVLFRRIFTPCGRRPRGR